MDKKRIGGVPLDAVERYEVTGSVEGFFKPGVEHKADQVKSKAGHLFDARDSLDDALQSLGMAYDRCGGVVEAQRIKRRINTLEVLIKALDNDEERRD